MPRGDVRAIPSWNREHEAVTVQCDCEQCGHPITGGMVYERRVFIVEGFRNCRSGERYPDEFRIERHHISPSCWEHDAWHT